MSFRDKVEKGLLSQILYFQSQWMDFKNLSNVWKLKRFCIACIDKFLNFKIFREFRFQFEFFFNFDFQMHKPSKKLCF